MEYDEGEIRLLRSVALQNANAVLLARERAEENSRQAKEELQRTNAALENILESITDAFISFDRDWRIVFVNKRAEELLQPLFVSKEKLLGRTHWEAFPDTVGTLVEENYRRALREQVPIKFENFFAPLSVWFEIRVYPSPAGLSVFFQDITERKSAEEKLYQQREWFEVTLSSIGDAVITTDIEGKVTFLNPVAKAMTGWQIAEAVGQPLEVVFKIVNELTGRTADNPIAKVLRHGLVVGLANHTALIAKDGRTMAIADSAAPIRDRTGSIVGAVMVFHDVTEKRKGELALRESESRFAALVNASAQIVWVADAQGGFVEFSPQWQQFTGQTFEEMKDWGRLTAIHPDDQKGLKAIWAKAISAREVMTTEYRVRHVSGEWRWMAVRAVPMLGADGSIQRWVGMHTDVTENRRAQDALRATESRKSAILNGSLDAIITMDHEGNVLDFNPAAERTFGYTQETAIGRQLAELIIPARLRERHRQGLKHYLATGVGPVLNKRVEMPAQRFDGGEFPIELSISRIQGIEPPMFTATLRDIQERKRIEEALRESESRLRATFNQAAVGIAIAGMDGRFLQVNEKFSAILGYSIEDLAAKTFIDLTHPDDAQLTRTHTDRLLSGEVSDIIYEKRYLRKDGNSVWSLTTVTLLKDASGKPERFIGVVEDISARKEAESERERLIKVLERSLNEIYIFNTETLRFEFVNEGARRNLGYTLEEMRLKTPLDLKPEFTKKSFLDMVQPLLNGEIEKHLFFTVHQRANGSIYPVEVHLQAVNYADQKVFLAVVLDITDRKKADEKLTDSEHRYRSLVSIVTDVPWQTDAEGRFVEPQSAWETYTGQTWTEHQEFGWVNAIHQEDREHIFQDWQKSCKNRGLYHTHGRLWHAQTKEWRFFEVRATPILDSEGQLKGWVGACRDTHEQRKAQEILRRSEEDLRALANSIPQLAWMADPEGNIFWYNSRWYEYTATTFEEMKDWGWQSVHDPQILPFVMERWRKSLDSGEPFDMEFPLRGRDGVFRWFLTRVNPLQGADGKIVRWFGTNTDVDDVRRTQEALVEETRVLELLNDTGRGIASQLDLQSVVQTVTDSATKLCGAKFGAFFYNVINDKGESFLLYTMSGAPREAFERFGMPRNTPIFNPTFSGAGVVRSADITQDPRYGTMDPHRGMPRGHLPVRSYLAVSVISRNGEVIGGLFFGHPEPNQFSERSERLILGVAAQAAIAIDNARLYDAAQQEIEQRKKAEEDLSRRIRLTSLRAEIGASIALSHDFSSILARCCEALVKFIDAAFARIWTLNSQTNVLELQASAGLYTHLNGPHSRIKMGEFKIGRIAQNQMPHLTNDVQNDPNVSDQNWARREKMVAFAGYPLIVDNKTVGVIAIFARDSISDSVLNEFSLIADGLAQWIQRTHAEAALRESEQKLADANVDLDKKIQERTLSLQQAIGQMEEFSYSVSHDLRAPIRAIEAYTRYMLTDFGNQIPREANSFLEKITRNTTRMNRMINDVLTLSRISRSEIQLHPVAVKSLLDEIIEQHPQMQPPNARIEIQADVTVTGDEISLSQALSNLLTNAIKFVQPGIVPHVKIWSESEYGKVRIWIEDNGIGIKPEHQTKLFGMFQRLQVNPAYEGTGVGLAIVKKAVERMGGTVGMESDGVKGSRFWIELNEPRNIGLE